MANEIDITKSNFNIELNNSIENATSIITKNYLDSLENFKIIVPSEEDTDIDISECGKFFRLKRLILNKEENFLDKLTTIINVASAIDSSLATIIKSDGNSIEYYIGIISKKHRANNINDINRRNADVQAFKGALCGNLSGAEIDELPKDYVLNFQKNTFVEDERCYAAVSGIVALRNENDRNIESYVQGIENLVDSLKGVEYTIIMLADPIRTNEIQIIKQGYEMLHTQLSTFLKNTIIFNENDTASISNAKTYGITEGISKGISMTQSTTNSKGKYKGINFSAGFNLGISANIGFNTGSSSSTSDTKGQTYSTTETNYRNRAVTDSVSTSKSLGKSFQINYENRSIKSLMDKIDIHLKRLDECESFGAFDCAAYVITEKREDALTVASNYNAIMRGKESSVQSSHINIWYPDKNNNTANIIGKYLESFVHPRFYGDNKNRIIVTPSLIMSGNELSIQIGLPKKSINGITVIPMSPFGRNIIENKNSSIYLGSLYHMGRDEGSDNSKQKVYIDIESLSMHTFITGSTGSGKSSTIYSILEKLMECNIKEENNDNKIKFMVIEPAKGEYKDRFSEYNNVFIYGTNSKKTPLLKINPFSFPKDIHVLEHIDRLIEIFNVCWPMYAAMPAVLKESIERAYICSGWDLENSECKYVNSKGIPLFPTFIDVLNQINNVMEESQYSSDSKNDYKGALCTRIKSLTNGLYGNIFTSDEISYEDLFDKNVIIDLSRVASSETKALIMGLLVIKLQEYRMACSNGYNKPLRHITVLEEAHNILKRVSTEKYSEGSNLIGKSVEMLSNSIAEMRTYGEGFIIADQSPNLVDMSVIRNTNTKIILRLPDLSDREIVGKASNLTSEQINEISRFKTFIASVYQNDWIEPVLCNIDINFKKNNTYKCDMVNLKNNIYFLKKDFINYLILPYSKRKTLDEKYISYLKENIWKLPLSSHVKISFIEYTSAHRKEDIQRLRGNIIYNIFNSERAILLSKSKENDIDLWYKNMCDVLEPDISQFSEKDRQRIVALIAKENAEVHNIENDYRLFNRFMKYI